MAALYTVINYILYWMEPVNTQPYSCMCILQDLVLPGTLHSPTHACVYYKTWCYLELYTVLLMHVYTTRPGVTWNSTQPYSCMCILQVLPGTLHSPTHACVYYWCYLELYTVLLMHVYTTGVIWNSTQSYSCMCILQVLPGTLRSPTHACVYYRTWCYLELYTVLLMHVYTTGVTWNSTLSYSCMCILQVLPWTLHSPTHACVY